MSPTFTILAAGLLVAQTADQSLYGGKTCPCQNKGASTGVIQPVAATQPSGFPSLPSLNVFRGSSEPAATAAPRPTLLAKMQGMFGKKSAVESIEPSAIPTTPTVPSATPGQYRQMQRLPEGQPNGTTPVAPNAMPAAPVKSVQPISYQGVPVNQTAVTTDGAGSKSVVPGTRPNRISADLVDKVGRDPNFGWITGQLRIENGVHVIHYATPEVVDQHNGSLMLTSDRDLRGFQDGDFVSVHGQVAGGAGRTTYRVTNIDRLPR